MTENPFTLNAEGKLSVVKSEIEQRFETFHENNPHVYHKLVNLARNLKAGGHGKIGIGMLFEVLRWQHMMATRDPSSSFKLNNDYRSHYARLIMKKEPDLDGIFDIRQLTSA